MKISKILALVCATSLVLVSCGKEEKRHDFSDLEEPRYESAETLIEKYEEACKEGDVARAVAVADRIEMKSLNSDQSKRMVKASDQGIKKSSEALRKISNAVPYDYRDRMLDQYESYITQYNSLIRQKATGKNVKDQMKKLKDKIDDMEDRLDDTKLTSSQEKRFDNLTDWFDEIK